MTEKTAAPATPSSTRIGPTIVVLTAGAVLALLSATMVGAIVTDIGAELGADLATLQWVTTAYLLAVVVAIPVAGWAIGRFGVRRSWLVAVGIFAIGGVASALAPDLGTLLAARAVQGFGGGAIEPLMLTAAARAAGPERMGRFMGPIGGVISIGPIAGPAIGGLVVEAADWRWAFAVVAIVSALVFLASAAIIRDRDSDGASLDTGGLLLLGGGAAASVFALSRISSPSGFDLAAAASLAVGIVAIVVFLLRARRRGADSIVDLAAFEHRGFAPAVTIMLLLGAAIYPLFFGLPQFYANVGGLSVAAAGLMIAPYGAGTLLSMTVAGTLSDRVPPARLVVTGALVSGAALAVLATTSTATPLWVFIAASFVLGVAIGFVGGPTVPTVYRVLPPRLVASGSTILMIGNQLGGVLGVALLVILIGRDEQGVATWSAAVGATPIWMPAIAVAAVALLAVRLRR